jgi:hypothetical protein
MTIEHTSEQSAPGASAAGGANAPAVQGQPSLKPGGIGTGVAFDWALAVQLVTDGICFILAFGPGNSLAGTALPLRLVVALFTFLAAALVFTQGEALRRGQRIARIIQIVANSLLVILGLVNLPDLLSSLPMRQFGSLVVELVLLVVNPLIVWLLTRKRTREWFATTTSVQARARHSGRWLFWMALYAIIGGLSVAFARYY